MKTQKALDLNTSSRILLNYKMKHEMWIYQLEEKWRKKIYTFDSMSACRNWSVIGWTCSLRIFLFESISIEWSINWSTSSWRLNNAASGSAILTLREPPRPGDSGRRMEGDGDGVLLRRAPSWDKLGDTDTDWWVEVLGTFSWCDSWSVRSKFLAKEVWPSSSSSSNPHISSWTKECWIRLRQRKK